MTDQLRDTLNSKNIDDYKESEPTAGEPRHLRRRRCDHICLLEDGHDGTHFEGYENPSPRRYDRMREWKLGRLHILWAVSDD